jgi:hypothetical protein
MNVEEFNDLEDINTNVEQNYNEDSSSTFEKAMEETKKKLFSFAKNLNNSECLQIFQKIIDNNIYVSANYKSKRYGMDTNHDFLPKYLEEKKDCNNINSNDNKNIFFYKDENRNEDYIKKKENEQTKVIIKPLINFNTIFIKEDKESNNLDRINVQENLQNNNNNFKLLGNKRNLDEKDKSNIEKKVIYDEIKEIYNNYQNSKDENKPLHIYSQGFIDKNETIIIDNKPICVVYFQNELLTKIFLISEKHEVEDDKTIIDILTNIRNQLKSKQTKKSFNIY